jgi:hypothetical protein
LEVGGIVIIDDYNDWSGCKKAVDDFFTPEIIDKYKFRLGEKLIIERKI